jgi:hypothetical protein
MKASASGVGERVSRSVGDGFLLSVEEGVRLGVVDDFRPGG